MEYIVIRINDSTALVSTFGGQFGAQNAVGVAHKRTFSDPKRKDLWVCAYNIAYQDDIGKIQKALRDVLIDCFAFWKHNSHLEAHMWSGSGPDYLTKMMFEAHDAPRADFVMSDDLYATVVCGKSPSRAADEREWLKVAQRISDGDGDMTQLTVSKQQHLAYSNFSNLTGLVEGWEETIIIPEVDAAIIKYLCAAAKWDDNGNPTGKEIVTSGANTDHPGHYVKLYTHTDLWRRLVTSGMASRYDLIFAHKPKGAGFSKGPVCSSRDLFSSVEEMIGKAFDGDVQLLLKVGEVE